MPSAAPVRRAGTNAAAFLIGLPLAAAVLGGVSHGAFEGTLLQRSLTPWVDRAEVVLFCVAVGALAARVRRLPTERRALAAGLLPAWDGRPVSAAESAKLLAALGAVPARLRDTYRGRRTAAALEFLAQRRSADELDDQLRDLADADLAACEAGYSLVRFITWAIPMLGFIGTVLGITQAIAGVTPEVLEQSLSSVTDGLALAFDSTALALCLTMVVMFCTYVVEHQEQGVLGEVDRAVERDLAHRFVRGGADAGPFVAVVQQATQAVLEATGQLVQRQAELWAQALAGLERRAGETHGKVAAAIDAALERTLTTHSQRLAKLEEHSVAASGRLAEQVAGLAAAVRETAREQQAALAKTAEAVAGQAAALVRVADGGQQLARLQATLVQNLAALEGAGAFEQAVHSLTAAVHLLTARAGRPAEASPALKVHPGGKAA